MAGVGEGDADLVGAVCADVVEHLATDGAPAPAVVPVGVHLVVVVEEGGFGGGGGLEGSFCELLVEFAGAPAPDGVGDEDKDDADADEPDDAEDPGYGTDVGEESKDIGSWVSEQR